MRGSNKERPFRRNISYLLSGYRIVRRQAPAFLPCIAAEALAASAQPLLVLLLSSRVLNELAGGRNIGAIALYAALAVGCSFVLSAAKAFFHRVACRDGEIAAYTRILSMEAEQFACMDFGHTEDSRITESLANMDVNMRGSGLGLLDLYYQSEQMIENLFSLVFASYLLAGLFSIREGNIRNFATSQWAMMGVFALLLAAVALSLLMRGKEKRVMDQMYADNAMANNTATFYDKYVQADMAAKDIRLYNQKKALLRIFEKSTDTHGWYRFFRFEGRLQGLNAAMLALVGGCAYGVIGLRALAGMYPIGDVMRYVGAVTAFSGALGALVLASGRLYVNAPHIKPLLDFLAIPRGREGGLPVHREEKGGYVFEFRNVSFRYPGAQMNALTDVNLTLHPGQRLAVVGLNGGGKTTLIKLLCRLYEPTSGEVLLDGVNVNTFDIDRYYRLFSVVFQDFALFPLTLGENVTLCETGDLERGTVDLGRAGFGKRLERLPAGLNAYLTKAYDEEGVNLSGGEAQKVALARALYKDAPIVILDEPTAALDPIAEHEVYTAFDETVGRRTAVFISHRLSSCCFCQHVAVFDGGRLVQYGSHDDLLADEGGRYRELWDAQARHYVD